MNDSSDCTELNKNTLKEDMLFISEKLFTASSRYKNLNFIGKGAYGIVISAFDTIEKNYVAIKKISPFHDKVYYQRTLREILILKRLKHVNIISILNIFHSPSNDELKTLYLVQELMEIDLSKLLKIQKLEFEHVRYFLYQILCGLKYIHSANVLHRDLKPSNLLINSSCDLKICDFGLSRIASPEKDYTGSLTEYVATRWYRAPEIMLNSRTYTKSVDIWSVGCIFAEMLTNKPLFPGNDYLHQLEIIFKVIGTPKIKELNYIRNEMAKKFVIDLKPCTRVSFKKYFRLDDNEAVKMLKEFLNFNPFDRITVEDALDLPFLQMYHNEEFETVAEIPFEFDIDPETLTREDLRKILYDEALKFD